MYTRSSDENSVCLSVKRVICEKKKKDLSRFFIPYERSFSLVFSNFGTTGLHWSEIADFQSIFARSASAVASSKNLN